MTAEPIPAPSAPPRAPRVPRAEGFARSVLNRPMMGRPVLSLVPSPARAKRAPFVALILGILAAGLVALLLLNTASAQDAFRLHRLQASASNVADQRQALSDQVNQMTGPAALAARAQQLGMIPMPAPVFWQPGTPLPPGARIVDGMVVVPAAGAPKTPAAAAPAPAVPANPADASVTAVPRPGQAPAGAKTSPTNTPTTTKPTATKPTASKPAATKPTVSKPTATTTKTSTGTTSTKPGTKSAPRATTTSGAGAHR